MTVKEERWVATAAYLLFFTPLLVCRNSRFGRFHSNQGLLLLGFYCLVNLIGRLIPFVGKYVIIPIANGGLLILMAIGMYYALTGQMKRLPLIGEFDIIK